MSRRTHSEVSYSRRQETVEIVAVDQTAISGPNEYVSIQQWAEQQHRTLSYEDALHFFTPVRYLGRGSSGLVDEVKVRHGGFTTLVRKSVFLPGGRRGGEQRQLVEREAKILAGFNYPHIVTFRGSFDVISNGRLSNYSLLMTPVGDDDLEQFFEKFDDSQGQCQTEGHLWIRKWFICLSSALSYIHGQGVRHEDIKPSNIIHRGSRIYFTDFNSARRFEIDHNTSTESPAQATARYAAPEILMKYLPDGSVQRHGRQSDVFSLGCVFLEMLTALDKRSVENLRDFCRAEAGLDSSPRQRANQSFTYSQILDSIDDWFPEGSTATEIQEIYRTILKPMLHPKREERPHAATVQSRMVQISGVLQLRCDCHHNAL